jgi:hypothetical protein
MRLKMYPTLLCLALIVSALASARAVSQNDEQNVRGAFLTTRPSSKKPTSTSRPPAGRPTGPPASRPHTPAGTSRPPADKPNIGKGGPGASSFDDSGAKGPGTSTVIASPGGEPAKASGPLGLGYTLYMRDAVGDAVRVNPTNEFRAGDRVRLVLESNADGYLYIFHTENDSDPKMIFPDARLGAGRNEIRAHFPYEVPSSLETREELRWFVFDANPATERLYVIIARRPLPGVPTGDDLVKYCRENQGRCEWRPTSDVWSLVKTYAGAIVNESRSTSYMGLGQKQSADERQDLATTRGFGLTQEAPQPAIIRMNASPGADVMVTRVDLIHK